MSRSARIALGAALLAPAAAAAWLCRGGVENLLRSAGVIERRTVAGVLAECGDRARARFEPSCRTWPPTSLTLFAFKRERRLEVWADGMRIATYPILGASGGPGPKRRAGDRQVPEGAYRLTALNPNSAHHLSVRIDYPNDDDVARSAVARESMGGDICLHGGTASVGCIAVGDAAIEELFCLCSLVEDRRIVIAPADLREVEIPTEDAGVRDLYDRLRAALATAGRRN